MYDDDDDKPFWLPNFDPYDALVQLGKNQEQLFNRNIIQNQYLRNLFDAINNQQEVINALHQQVLYLTQEIQKQNSPKTIVKQENL